MADRPKIIPIDPLAHSDLDDDAVENHNILDGTIEAPKFDSFTITQAQAARIFALDSQITSNQGAAQTARIILAHGAVKLAEGDVVTIGADTYEFRDSTPPLGGTAGNIWVYNGANSAASRTNLIDAINGVVAAARITRTSVTNPTAGTNTELVYAEAGTPASSVQVSTADAIGGNVMATDAVPLVLSETTHLSTGTDVWDAAGLYAGVANGLGLLSVVSVLLTAEHIVNATIEIVFPFNITSVVVFNNNRPQNEATTIAANKVSLALAGAGDPNNVAGDTLTFLAFR